MDDEPLMPFARCTRLGFIKVRLRDEPEGRNLLEAAMGMPAPPPNRQNSVDEHMLASIGPEEWIISCPLALMENVLGMVMAAVQGAVSLVVDITAGRAAYEIEGEAARRLISICPVDLRPESFPSDAVARTLVGEIPVMIIRLPLQRFRVLIDQSRSEPFEKLMTSTAQTRRPDSTRP